MTTDTTSRMPSILPTTDDVDEKSDYLEYYAKRLLEVSPPPSNRPSPPPSVKKKKKKEKEGEAEEKKTEGTRTMKHILMKLRRQRQDMIQKYGNGDQVFELFLAICDKLKGRPPNEVEMVKRQICSILHSHNNNSNNNSNNNNNNNAGGGRGDDSTPTKVDDSAEVPPSSPLLDDSLSREVSSSPLNNTEYEDFSQELDYLLEEGYDFGNEILFSLPTLSPLEEIGSSSSTTSSSAPSSSY